MYALESWVWDFLGMHISAVFMMWLDGWQTNLYVWKQVMEDLKAHVKKGGRLCTNCQGQDALWPIRPAQEDMEVLNEKVTQIAAKALQSHRGGLTEAHRSSPRVSNRIFLPVGVTNLCASHWIQYSHEHS